MTTTYSHDANTGELTSVTYNDAGYANPTPSVGYTYKRTGQLDTVTDATGQRTFNYNGTDALQLDSISLPAYYGSRQLTRQYDGVYRPDGFELGTAATPGADLVQTYTYDTLGRFQQLATTADSVSHTFGYTYYPVDPANPTGAKSPLVAGYTMGSFAVTYGYEAHRDLVTSVASKWSSGVVTEYDYTYNTLALRGTEQQSGSEFADQGTTTWNNNYDARGELKSSADYLGTDVTNTANQMSDRNFGYQFDDFGNRLQSSIHGFGANVAVGNYTVNVDNSYGNATVPYARATGTASSQATVTVSGGGRGWVTGAEGSYWAADTALGSSDTTPTAVPLTITATLSGGASQSDTSRTAYLPQYNQTYGYDLNGNLTSDGLWTYNYDAENRLISATSVAITGFPNQLIDFQYDYLGRRVQKKVANYNGSTYVLSYARRYLYDGNNLVAEFDSDGSSCGSLHRSYAWGLDVAGSLTGTGGVGALMQITDHTTHAEYLPTYNANGNVASLVNAADGSMAAVYEYSPFGELLRCEGPYAKLNPFRFSTKYTDDETGLVYYGARYYSPGLGRFVNRDPIEEAGGINLYGFCGNDAINHTDYLGNLSLGDFLNPFSKKNPLNPFGNTSRKIANWSQAHGFGATLLGSPFALLGQARDTWHFAQQNPQIAAVVAAIATWYIGGWGAAAIYPAITATETTVVAGALAGAAGGFVGARASGADLSTSFRAAYQGAAWGGALAFASNEILGAKFTSFSVRGAANAFVTDEARYEVGRFAQNKLGISGWEFDLGLEAVSYLGYKAFGDPYHDTQKGNHGSFLYIGGFGDRDPSTGWFFSSGHNPIAHYVGEFMFDVNDQLLQWQGLPDAGGIKYAYHGLTLPNTGHSLGASRLVTLASLGLINGGNAVALPFGEIAPGGVQPFIGNGDIIPGSYLGLGFNPEANVGSVPFVTGHAFNAYIKAFPQL